MLNVLRWVLLMGFGCLSASACAQLDVIWQANFEDSEQLPAFWNMDENSAAQRNRWRLGTTYSQAGHPSISDQPDGTPGGPRSRYLFIGAETPPAIHLADYDRLRASRCTLTTPFINALQYAQLRFSAIYLCGGQPGRDFGQILVRELDGPWLELTPPLLGESAGWVPLAVEGPLGDLDNRLLQFALVWQNDADGLGNAPSFALDEFRLEGARLDQGVIALLDPAARFCAGAEGQLIWLAYGSFNAGNTFHAQLSDADGQFGPDSPIVGTTVSRSAEGAIPFRLPADLQVGGSYRLRILATQPQTVSANTVTLPLVPSPQAGRILAAEPTVCPGSSALLELTDYAGTIRWQFSSTGTDYTEVPFSDLDFYVSDPLDGPTWFRARVFEPGCGSVFSAPVRIDVRSRPQPGDIAADLDRRCAPGPVSLTLSGQSPGSRIQWEISDDGFEFFEALNGTDSRFRIEDLASELYVRAAVRSAECPQQPAYTEALRIAYGLDVLVETQPSVPLPGEPVEFFLAIDGNDMPISIAFSAGDGSDPRFFESIESNRFSFSHTYTEEGFYNYDILVVEDDNDARCEGRASGTVRVSEQAIELAFTLPPFICLPFTGEARFSPVGTFEPDNRFEVQLSDADGRFDNPRTVGSGLNSPIAFTLPADLPAGDRYALRVVSTSPTAASGSIMGIELAPGIDRGRVSVTPNQVCTPETVELTLADYDLFSLIEWEISLDGVNFESLPDSDVPVYEYGPLDQSAWFRASLTPFGSGGCGQTYSDTAYVRVGLGISLNIEPTVPTAGEPVRFRLLVEGAEPPFDLDVDLGDGNTFETRVESLPFALDHVYAEEGDYEIEAAVSNLAGTCVGVFRTILSVEPEEFQILSVLDVQPEGPWCPGETIEARVLVEGPFGALNQLLLELSDAQGSFERPVILSQSRLGSGSHLLQGRVPFGLPEGSGYLVRLRSTMPEATGLSLTAFTLYPSSDRPELTRVQDSLLASALEGLTLRWYLNDAEIAEAQGLRAWQPRLSGLYTVETEDGNGCRRPSEALFFQLTTRPGSGPDGRIEVYPNPARDRLFVRYSLDTPAERLAVVDANGRQVYRDAPQDAQGELSLDLTGWAAGLYLLHVETAGGQRYSLKFVIAD